MNNLTIFAALFALLLFVINSAMKTEKVQLQGKKTEQYLFALITIAVTAVKIFLAPSFYGHSSDMSLFSAWADLGRYESVTEFYGVTGENYFVDYPPLYLYVLAAVGRFCGTFDITFGSDLYITLIKLIPILADTATVLAVYRIASHVGTKRQAMLMGLCVLLNPAYVLNSVIWGQIDGLYTLVILWLLYTLYQKRYTQAVLAFTVGILTKPQMLIFLPLLGFCVLYDVVQDAKEKKYSSLRGCLLGLVLSALMVFISAVPIFGLDFSRFIGLYTRAAGQYPYASLNASNLFGAFGLNWADVTETFLGITYQNWGFIGIILTSLAVGGFICFAKDRTAVFVGGGFTVFSIYMLAHTMHERYLFPLILILLVLYIVTEDKRMLFSFGATTLLHLLHTGMVLLDNEGIITYSKGAFIAMSWVHILFYVYLTAVWFSITVLGKVQKTETVTPKILCMEPRKKRTRLTRQDGIIMIVFTVVYAITAFCNLGSFSAPESGWYPTEPEESVVLDFGTEQSFHRVNFFLGWIDRRDTDREVERILTVSFGNQKDASAQSPVFGEKTELVVDSVFDWDGFFTEETGRYMKISVDEGDFYLEEIACYDSEQRLLTPKTVYEGNETAPALFDEQSMALYEYTWYDGTYFDEVYHPRTAYEYIHGLWPYENTHPPLGKLIIGLGIMLFGMNPFGWRFFGTLFGVLMVPVVYLFAKQLLKNTKWAFFACALFTFDFMHLVQTRLATIDSYTAFFVMLMYYFMYQFTCKNFYRDGVAKTLPPLLFSGLFFGIGVAVKWQGVYAGIGLCVMFFKTLYQRYKEYLAAKDGRFVGDSETVLHAFIPNTVKTLLAAVVCFILIPFGIYFASYLPIILSESADISYFWENQESMLSYHSGLTEKHPYGSSWWSWPLDLRPLYAYNPNWDFVSTGVAQGISSFGNPLVWWLTIPSIGYLIRRTAKGKGTKETFTVLAGFFAMFLPWILISRQAYIYHFFPCVAFVSIGAAFGARTLGRKYPVLRKWIWGYLFLAMILYFVFYPVLTGIRIPVWYADILTWLPTWVLG